MLWIWDSTLGWLVRSAIHAGAASLLVITLAFPAFADPRSEELASLAYARGEAAASRQDYPAAARAFAAADAYAPNAVALEAALKTSLLADDAVFAMSLVSRANRSAETAALPVVKEVFERFRRAGGTIVAECASEDACKLSIDGASVSGQSAWVLAGDHGVALVGEGRVREEVVHIEGGGSVVVTLPARVPIAVPPPRQVPEAEAPADGSSSDGMHWTQVVFWTAIGADTVLTATTIVWGVRLRQHHGQFVALGCETPGLGRHDECQIVASDGKTTQTELHVLTGVTVGATVATALYGALGVRWSDPMQPDRLQVVVAPGHFALRGTW